SLRGTIDSGVSLSQSAMQVPADLAALPVPPRAASAISGASYGGQTEATFQPGAFVGVQAYDPANINLAPGVYYLTGGLSISGTAQVTGQDVLLYFASGSSLNLSGGGSLTLTPPSSGAYQGVALFAARTSPIPLSISGNASLLFSGTIY